MSGKWWLTVLLCCLLLIWVCGCGGDGGEDASCGISGWLTETSVEDPGAWFSVSVLPVE